MAIMTHAKFHFNRLMLTLIFGIRPSEPPGPGERRKKPGLIGLRSKYAHRKTRRQTRNISGHADNSEFSEIS